MAKLAKIIYKGFEFPYNPATTSYKIDRTYIKHKYPELAGNELEDFGPNACVISGSGEFFGNNAYSNWKKLLKEFKTAEVGSVSHPVFTDVTRGLMTSLQATLEPREDYVKYAFEIVADTELSINETLGKYISVISGENWVDSGNNAGSSSGSGGELVHIVSSGECLSVICAKYAKKFNTTISWKKIAEHNNLKDPSRIFPGNKIKIYYPT